jgi:PAS domain S-box-containing protein
MPDPSGRRSRLLIVDDTEANRYAIARQLRANGFEVLEAATGQDAIDVAIAQQPDLMVLDIKLPDVSGLEVARRLRNDRRTADIPILHLSASFTDSASQARGLDNGADGYLTHPVDPLVMLATVRSLLRAREAERQTFAAARDWSTTFDTIVEGVCITDPDGQIRRCNRAFRELLGSGQGRTDAQRFADLSMAVAQSTSLADTGPPGQERSWRVEVGSRWLRVSSVPVRESAGELPSVVWVLTDLTQERRADEQARLALQLESTGRLAGGVAHEINNMMTVILASAEFALQGLEPGHPSREELNAIHQAASRSAEVARQLLTFSRRQVLKPKPVDCHALLGRLEGAIRRLLGADRTLHMELNAPRPWVVVDPLGMEQVIINLALNARDAMPQGGVLTMTTSNIHIGDDLVRRHPEIVIRTGPYVQVEVTDTGYGMDTATRERIFEPFFTTKGVGEGTGLGLATVFGMVKQSGGYIWAESEPGHGTSFRLQLPETAKPAAATSTGARSRAVPAGLGTILLVEDEPLVQALLRRTLKEAGFDVAVAKDGNEALAILERQGGDITAVVSDVIMPNLGGWELAHRIRERWPAIPVLFMSGHTNEEIMRRGLLGSDEPFIQKPFSPAAFTAAVADLLARRNGATS